MLENLGYLCIAICAAGVTAFLCAIAYAIYDISQINNPKRKVDCGPMLRLIFRE
jgi:hypothetical protein